MEKLIGYVEKMDPAATNVYTLPYVIIALSQAEDYATDEQMDMLISHAVSNKKAWVNNEWGTDAASAMILALSPYYNENPELKDAVDEGTELIISSQSEDGSVENAAATGLAICALSALGQDAAEVISGESSLIDGLMVFASDEQDGFLPMENSFSTEQGLRGILAYQLYSKEAGLRMYDFSEYPMEEAYASKKSSSSGGGSSTSSDDESADETAVNTDKTTEVVQPQVITEEKPLTTSNINPDVKIKPISDPAKTFADIEKHKDKSKIKALAQRGIINGKSEKSFDPDSTMTRAEFATIIARGLGLPDKGPASFDDVQSTDWYSNYIGTAYAYGIIKGISDTQFNPSGTITRQEAVVMVARAAKLCGMVADTDETFIKDTISVFNDYTAIGDWAKEEMAFCLDKGILTENATEIFPSKAVTRAEIAVMLYNMLDVSAVINGEEK